MVFIRVFILIKVSLDMVRQLRSAQRRWRTRPSEVRASIMMGDIDFFEAHKNSTFRVSFIDIYI